MASLPEVLVMNQRQASALCLAPVAKPVNRQSRPSGRSHQPVLRLLCPPSSSPDAVPAFFKQQDSQARHRVQSNFQQLESQADKINQLSAALESAIAELTATVAEINFDSRLLSRRSPNGFAACEYREVRLPVVRQKSAGRLVLMTRPVDLRRQEREAYLLAQQLRDRDRPHP
ncbi:MAG: hypothetical protein HC890_05735 [Chloroflexaceae bacterium]|nr:hypothetical protein [Chloroflexaceae bacterium]